MYPYSWSLVVVRILWSQVELYISAIHLACCISLETLIYWISVQHCLGSLLTPKCWSIQADLAHPWWLFTIGASHLIFGLPRRSSDCLYLRWHDRSGWEIGRFHLFPHLEMDHWEIDSWSVCSFRRPISSSISFVSCCHLPRLFSSCPSSSSTRSPSRGQAGEVLSKIGLGVASFSGNCLGKMKFREVRTFLVCEL